MNRKITVPALSSAFARHVLRRPTHYADLCTRRWTIAPAEVRIEPKAVYLPGELEKVRAVQENTTLEAEMTRIGGGQRHHAATTAYQLKDVRLRDGRLFKGAMNHRVSQLALAAPASEEVTMPSAALGSTLMGSIYFGHWMRDDASLRMALDAFGPPIEVARQAYSHEAGYRSLLSLPENRLTRGRFGELVLLDDVGQNADKRRRYQALRGVFRQATGGAGNERIYIKRGRAIGARGRDLVNAAEVERRLVAQGFTVVDPDAMSAAEIAHASLGAKIILGLEGSHLAHAIYPIAEGGTIVVLQPPHRFNNVYKDLADAVGLSYAFVVGDPAEGGFTIDAERLDRLLERVGRSVVPVAA